jgi:hypothetical protein
MLLLSSISREDGELVELNAVLGGQPGTHAKALVRLAIHANPRILGVHFMHDLVPLHLRLAGNKAKEQLVCLLGLCNCDIALGLRVFVILRGFFLRSSLLDFVSLSGNSSSGCISLLTSSITSKAFLS